MGHGKKGEIIGTIIGLVIAAFFILIAMSVLGDFFGQFPRVSGAIGDAEKVVCFGGGSDHYVHCLNKDTGSELFSVGSGTKWNLADAKSTPTLTKDAIYFGLGQYFCGFTMAGTPKFECKKFDHIIPTGVAVDETKDLACFGDGVAHTVYCRSASDGQEKFSVHGSWGDCPLGQRVELKKDGRTKVNGHDIHYAGQDPNGNVVVDVDGSGRTISDEGVISIINGVKIIVMGHDTSAIILLVGEPECRAMSTPTISSDYVYFGLGNRVCKYRAGFSGEGKPATDTSREWCQKTDWTIPTGVAVDESRGLVCYGGGDDHNIWCRNKDSGAWEFNVRGNWGDCPNLNGCIAVSTPTITSNAIYFGLGNRVCKYKIDTLASHDAAAASDASRLWCSNPLPHTVVTKIAVDETLGYACFGADGEHMVRCINTEDGSEIFKVHAGNWDATDANSAPVIKNGAVYIGLGDKACAFKLPTQGDTYKDFERRHNKNYKADGDVDVMWKDADSGCADFDWQISTDIGAFYTPEEQAAAREKQVPRLECQDGEIDLSLSDISVTDANGDSLDKNNFPANAPFSISTTLLPLDSACDAFATIGLYATAPGQAKQFLTSLSAVTPGETKTFAATSLPASGAGNYVLEFRLLSTTPQVQSGLQAANDIIITTLIVE